MADQRRDELACIYAALVLSDDDIPVTSEKINTILKAAEVPVERIWPNLFAKALDGLNIKEFIFKSIMTASPAGAPASSPAAATTGETSEQKPEDKAQEAADDDDDSDDDMGFGLFD